MLLIKNNDDTPVTIKTYSAIDPLKIYYYLKFTDSSNTNVKILEVINQSAQPKYYNRFLILENSDIPVGRGVMEFYASVQTGLTKLNKNDLINSQEYELKAVSAFEIVQYEPAKIDYIYYRQKIEIPQKTQLLRHLSEYRDRKILDTVSGSDVGVLLPVSEFDGVDGNVVAPDRITLTAFTLRVTIMSLPAGNRVLLGDTSLNTNNIWVSNWGRISIRKQNSSFVDIFNSITLGVEVTIVYNGVNFTASCCSSEQITPVTDFEFVFNKIGGYAASINFFEGGAHSININNELLIPLPHLGVGFDDQGNEIGLAVNGGVTEGFDAQGTSYYQNETTNKLNTSPAVLELFAAGQTEEINTFFDTSNILIWKTAFAWNFSQVTQQFIEENIQDAYKDRLFVKIKNNVIIDILLYKQALSETQLTSIHRYLND